MSPRAMQPRPTPDLNEPCLPRLPNPPTSPAPCPCHPTPPHGLTRPCPTLPDPPAGAQPARRPAHGDILGILCPGTWRPRRGSAGSTVGTVTRALTSGSCLYRGSHGAGVNAALAPDVGVSPGISRSDLARCLPPQLFLSPVAVFAGLGLTIVGINICCARCPVLLAG